jgi:hypothetical protein
MVDKIEEPRVEVKAALAKVRMNIGFDQATCGEDDRFLQELKTAVLSTLDRLEAELNIADSPTHLRLIEEQIEECSQKHVYWLDAHRIQTEADASIREMRNWGVPQRYLDENIFPLQQAVKMALAEAANSTSPAHKLAALRRAQTTLGTILDEFSYWDSYTDRYVSRFLYPLVFYLGGLGLLSLIAAFIIGFKYQLNLFAVLLAGFAGTCISILLKQEPLSVYGDTVKARIWAVGRVLTGVIATVIGMGLLSTGFINVGFTANPGDGAVAFVPLHTLIHNCLDPVDVQTGTNATVMRPDAGRVESRNTAPDGGPSESAASTTVQSPTAVQNPTPVPACSQKPCGNTALLLLLGLAVLFGFSERVFAKIMAQFEDKISNAAGTTPSPTPPTGLPPRPEVPTGQAGDSIKLPPEVVADKPPEPAAKTSPPKLPQPAPSRKEPPSGQSSDSIKLPSEVPADKPLEPAAKTSPPRLPQQAPSRKEPPSGQSSDSIKLPSEVLADKPSEPAAKTSPLKLPQQAPSRKEPG